MDDGRSLVLDLSEPQNLPYLFHGRVPYELGEERVVRTLVKAGEQVIDVGANVGWYSTMLAELVGPQGRVYAFEPNTDLARNLTLTAADYPWLQVISSAVGDADGQGILRISRLLGNSSLEASTPEQVGSQACPVVTLDGFLETIGNPRITFIKSDTEGGELRVLMGARRILSAPTPPACFIEVNPHYGLRPAALTALFDDLWHGDYSAWKIHPQAGSLIPPVFGSDVSNGLFIHNWQLSRVAGLIAA
jgi:FkbM family methyltransferase